MGTLSDTLDAMVKAGIPRDQIKQYAADMAAIQMHPQFVVDPGPANSPNAKTVQYMPEEREWENDPPMTYDAMANKLSPLGALYLRLNIPAGNMLPAGIQHISAHVVQKRGTLDGIAHPVEKAYVFIVNDKGEALTLEDETPSMFPSDTLVLQVKMIMDSAEMKPGHAKVLGSGVMTASGMQTAQQVLNKTTRAQLDALHDPNF